MVQVNYQCHIGYPDLDFYLNAILDFLITFIHEILVTIPPLIWFITSTYPQLAFEVAIFQESLFTMSALQWFLASVHTQGTFEVAIF